MNNNTIEVGNAICQFDNNFKPLPISNLLDGKHNFLIPSFQRGYRWEKKQVLDLLEDIKQFANDEKANSDSYFLQPIVVKATQYNNNIVWEVLDGQQRLTTMLLLLKRIMRRLSEDERDTYESLLYTINYANRPQLNFDNPNAADNIDSYYLASAKQVIDEWFNKQKENKQNLNNFIGTLLYNQKRQVKIIWYAIDENSNDLLSISIFNRLNKGKISLTSSELIKALFIMDYDLNSEKMNITTDQLSLEWNEMEKKFQNDNFWYFISDDKKDIQTRIDILFDFVTRRPKDSDTDYSYREFQKLYDFCREQEREKTDDVFPSQWTIDINNMQDVWKQVRKTYDCLVAWYEDNLYYHYVGYLVAIGFTPLEIYNHLEQEKTRIKLSQPKYEWTDEDTQQALRRMMMERFKEANKYIEKEAIDDFEYNSEYVKRVLLLFNIESCRNGDNVRFAFDKYKKENWDVEHVESQNDATLQEYDDRIRWLNQVNFILKREGTERALELANICEKHINDFTVNKKVNVELYRQFYTTINKFYSKEVDENEDEVELKNKRKDSLSNLTLLDSSTNREYKDAPFAFKRYYLIEKDKKGECFIPICTRNLFLKYYSDSNNKASYLDNLRWNKVDREDYMKALHNAVDPIFDSVKNIEKEDKDEQ